MRLNVLVSYDVNVQDAAGRKRLRKASKQCVNFGQRVQWSVFECCVTEAQLDDLRHRLLGIIDPAKDSLRIYRLPGERGKCVESYGLDQFVDPQDPLIV